MNLHALMVASLSVCVASTAHAQPIIYQVTNYADAFPTPPAGSFRAAWNAALAHPGFDVIEFTTTTVGTIYAVQPFVAKAGQEVRVTGHNMPSFLAQSGVTNSTLFQFTTGGNQSELSGVYIGASPGAGNRMRGVYVGAGTLVYLGDDVIHDFSNPTHLSANGGCVLCYGYCQIVQTHLNACGATTGYGGAIYSNYRLNLYYSYISDSTAKYGGAVAQAQPADYLAVQDVTVVGNSALFDGGAFWSDTTASTYWLLSNVSATNNSAGGHGGAVARTGGILVINDSDLINNTAAGDGFGHEIYASNVGSSLFIVENSIIGHAQPSSGTCLFNTTPSSSSVGNLVSDASCGLSTTTNHVGIDVLASLGTWTVVPCWATVQPRDLGGCLLYPLLSTSPARHYGSAGCAMRDQRNYTRPGGICDSGVYQYDGMP